MRAKIVLCTLAFIFALPGYCEQSFSLDRALPERTLVFVSFPDLQAALKALKNTGLGQMAQDEEIGRFFANLPVALCQEINREIESEIGPYLPYLARLSPREISIALVDAEEMPGILLAADMGMDNQTFLECLQAMQKDISSDEQALCFVSYEHGGYTIFYSTLEAKEPLPLCSGIGFFTFIGNTFLYSTTEVLLHEALGCIEKKESLFNVGDYAQARRKVQGTRTPVVFAYLNMAKIGDSLVECAEEDRIIALFTSAIRGIESVSLGVNIEGKDIHAMLYISAPEARRGILNLLTDQPVDRGLVRHAPPSAVSFWAMRLNWNQKKEDLEKFLMEFDGRIYCEYLAQKSIWEKDLGFSLEEDLFPLIGDQYCGFSYFPREGGAFPHTICVYSLKQPEKLLRCIRSEARALSLSIRETIHKGRIVYYYTSPVGEWGKNPLEELETMLLYPKEDEIYDAPYHEEEIYEAGKLREAVKKMVALTASGSAFFLHRDKVYSAFYLQALKDFIEDRAEWKGDFSQNPEWIACSSRLDPNVYFFYYGDWRRTFSTLWDTILLTILSERGDWEEEMHMLLSLEFIPRGKCIARYLPIIFLSGAADPEGISWELYLKTPEIPMMEEGRD